MPPILVSVTKTGLSGVLRKKIHEVGKGWGDVGNKSERSYRGVQGEYDQNNLYEFLKELKKCYKNSSGSHHTNLSCGLSMPTCLCSTVKMVANGGQGKCLSE